MKSLLNAKNSFRKTNSKLGEKDIQIYNGNETVSRDKVTRSNELDKEKDINYLISLLDLKEKRIKELEGLNGGVQNNSKKILEEKNIISLDVKNENNMMNIRENTNLSKKLDSTNTYNNNTNPMSINTDQNIATVEKKPQDHMFKQLETPIKHKGYPSKQNTPGISKVNSKQENSNKTNEISENRLNTHSLEIEHTLTALEFTEDQLNDFTYIIIKNLEATRLKPIEILDVNKHI